MAKSNRIYGKNVVVKGLTNVKWSEIVSGNDDGKRSISFIVDKAKWMEINKEIRVLADNVSERYKTSSGKFKNFGNNLKVDDEIVAGSYVFNFSTYKDIKVVFKAGTTNKTIRELGKDSIVKVIFTPSVGWNDKGEPLPQMILKAIAIDKLVAYKAKEEVVDFGDDEDYEEGEEIVNTGSDIDEEDDEDYEEEAPVEEAPKKKKKVKKKVTPTAPVEEEEDEEFEEE